jgi:hypothetical protein
MAKPLDPKTVIVHPTGHLASEWQVRLPASVSFGDIFRPAIWADVENLMRGRGGMKRPAKDDLIRIIGNGFDVMCLVEAVDAGYRLAFYAGKRPSAVSQVLDDLDALPDTGSSAELRAQAKTLKKRWAAAGIRREDISSARRAYAKSNHPDTSAVDGQRLAAANAVLDAALASLQEAA